MKLRHAPLLLPALLLLQSSSCHRKHHHGPVVVVVEENDGRDVVLDEIEPNDDAFNADFLGTLAPGDRVVVRGEVDECCDVFDGFAFVSSEPLLVDVFLESHDGADLDLCIYDPLIEDFSLCFENAGTLEEGAFEVTLTDAEFHVVVTPFDFGSRYTLEVVASPLLLPKATGAGPAPAGAGALRAVDGHGAGSGRAGRLAGEYGPRGAAAETAADSARTRAVTGS